jgi:hypothetical protein
MERYEMIKAHRRIMGENAWIASSVTDVPNHVAKIIDLLPFRTTSAMMFGAIAT